MSSEPREYLRHILAEADYLISQRTGLKFEDFVADETLRRAVVRSLEIIGEAAKKVCRSLSRKPHTIGHADRTGRRARAALYPQIMLDMDIPRSA